MRFYFTEALDAIAQGCTSAVKGLTEQILTPLSKRKRSETDGDMSPDLQEQRSAKLQATREGVQRQTSLSPPSQFAVAAAPLPETPDAGAGPLAQRETPFAGLPASTAHATRPEEEDGWVAASEPVSPAPRVPGLQGRLADRRNWGARHRSAAAPWQQRYPAWDSKRPAQPSQPSNQLHPGYAHFARAAHEERFSMRPGSALWKTYHGRNTLQHSRFHNRHMSPREGSYLRGVRHDNRQTSHPASMQEEKEMLQWMTQDAKQQRAPRLGQARRHTKVVDLENYDLLPPSEASAYGWQSNRRAFGTTRPAEQSEGPPAWLAARSMPTDSLDLSVARFEIEQARKQRETELAKQDAAELLARCKELMGETQTTLMERASAALGESAQEPSRIAEISKASMAAASRQAAGLTSEEDVLEEQQHAMRELREMQRAHQAAASVAQPRKASGSSPPESKAPAAHTGTLPRVNLAKSRVKPQAKKDIAEEVVDLVSSDEEDGGAAKQQASVVAQQAASRGSPGNEEAEASQQSTAFDDAEEEEEVLAKLQDVGVHERLQPSQYLPLTTKQRALYRDATNRLADQDKELHLVKSRNIYMTRGLLACLQPRTWLNDEVVNGFTGLLQERDKAWRSGGDHPKCHFFTTFFFNKLYLDASRYNYDEVLRWTRPKKLKGAFQASQSILDCDRIIAPVHLAVHWTCAMADLRKKEFVYLDSMMGREEDIMECFRRYIADEYKDKKQQDIDTSTWPIRYPSTVPQQQNGCDCGVFALMFAEHLSRDAPLDFDQQDMQYFRVMIGASLMALQAPTDFDA